MSDSPLKPHGDITVVSGKYMKDGKEKNRYTKVGVLLATPHFSRIAIKLESLPFQTNDKGELWLNVFPNEDADQKPKKDWVEPETREKFKKDTVAEVNKDEPIRLDDIPF